MGVEGCAEEVADRDSERVRNRVAWKEGGMDGLTGLALVHRVVLRFGVAK